MECILTQTTTATSFLLSTQYHVRITFTVYEPISRLSRALPEEAHYLGTHSPNIRRFLLPRPRILLGEKPVACISSRRFWTCLATEQPWRYKAIFHCRRAADESRVEERPRLTRRNRRSSIGTFGSGLNVSFHATRASPLTDNAEHYKHRVSA